MLSYIYDVDLASQGGMVHNDAPLSHRFLKIAQAQGINQILAETLCNKIARIMQMPDDVSDQKHVQATSQKKGKLPDKVLMRQNENNVPLISYFLGENK